MSLRRAAGLLAAVIVAVVSVHVPLPQLPARLVLLPAAAVAVAVVLGPPPVLRVVPGAVVVAVDVIPGAIVGLVSLGKALSALGVVQRLEVAVVAAQGVALRCHLQVGPDAVVPRPRIVAEVDDAALVGALVGRLDPGKAELVGDVAAYDLHHLTNKEETQIKRCQIYCGSKAKALNAKNTFKPIP